MAKLVLIFVSLLAISMTLAKPAKNEALDKATATDIVINSVNPDQKTSPNVEVDKTAAADSSNSNTEVYQTAVNFAPPISQVAKPGVGIARIIDDIFQIPIGVLQSVSRLLSNPFIQHKTPETASSY